MILKIPNGISGFMEDKDYARQIRRKRILPALEKKEKVVLDFSEVEFATQSFIHALIGEALKRFPDDALNLLEFRSCNQILKSVIEIVVDYSYTDFAGNMSVNARPSSMVVEKI